MWLPPNLDVISTVISSLDFENNTVGSRTEQRLVTIVRSLTHLTVVEIQG